MKLFIHFLLQVDICQMGLDQRKVNMLARDYCEASKRNSRPIILSRHMSSGIKEGQQKMSKSDPSSAIFMEDSESQVNEKIRLAFCPHKVTEGNLCLEYIEYIVLPKSGRFAVLCKETDGSNSLFAITLKSILTPKLCLILSRRTEEPVGLKCRVEVIIPARNLNAVVPEPCVDSASSPMIGCKTCGVL
ncbi:tyrosine--tRNA ligase 1, cytoplasmic-like [Panicum hallii]|uniref:tyrosine--tRNA ligase 1, cytoplasmic-like n=1 Tax=Panicum hallii TaxID=206008 RepID=UPI000DF4E2B9|nr:tyrosine--tRNA ligase 1, cytoplasmic-like [Panicum hallii]